MRQLTHEIFVNQPENPCTEGHCKSWTLDCGLDHGLDYGLRFGLHFGLNFGLLSNKVAIIVSKVK